MSIPPVTLEGQRVRLEPLADQHVPALRAAASDAQIWRYMPLPWQDPLVAFAAWHRRATAARERGNAFVFATIARDTGQPVGGTTMQDISAEHRSLEIGSTWLNPSRWRTGLNAEAKLLMLTHAFEVLGCNRVQLKTDARNVRSQTAIERLGATREGVLRAHMIMPDGHVRDSVMYSILASEWPAVRVRLAEGGKR